MPLFSNRRAKSASKWHESVVATVGNVQPAPTASSGGRFHLFPYAQLQVLTKEYLGKKKRTEAEQDELLIQLIQDHHYKEVAFAACLEYLSTGAAQDLLDNSFQVDLNTSNGLEQYLQAFVAAAQCKESLGLIQDRNFASSLASVARAVSTQGIGPTAAGHLLATWSIGCPNNRLLLKRARALTTRVFQQVESELNAFKTQLALGIIDSKLCDRVVGYRTVFAAYNELDDSITSSVACWRGWASWVPNARLRSWTTIATGSVFACLIELEGPDLRVDTPNANSEWQALARNGQLLHWLESKGFTLGAGLITGDSEELFINSFLDCALTSLKRNSSTLLQYLIKKNDLDSHTLRSWHAADSLLQPQFVSLLLSKSSSEPNNVDGTLIQGLNDLANDITHAVRKPLNSEIVSCVRDALENLLSGFPFSFATDNDWTGLAKRLWALRRSVATAGWLHQSLDPSTVAMCNLQAPNHSLTTLLDLYNAINSHDSRGHSTLQNCFEIYVQSFILQGSASADETTKIPHALHGAWLYIQRQSFRDVTRRIASIEALDVVHRLNAIRKLQGVSEEAVVRLESCLDSLSQGEVLEIMNFADLVASLQASPSQDPCWRALLLYAAKSGNVRIDNKEFTSLGYSIYQQCVEALHDIVGGDLELVPSTHSWLEQLQSVEGIITTLEADGDSYPAIHCILAEQQPDIRTRYLKMLQCYSKQTDAARKTLLQELILALRSTNSAHVAQAVMAISKVDSKGFTQCEDLLMICRADKNVAAVRLSVWLKMGELNDATEAALSSLGQVLNLGLDNDMKPPSTTFEAARKDYAKRVAALVARAQQLENTRISLRRTDPDGVKAMATELGLEVPPSGVAALTANLPNELSGVINEIGDDEVEFQFALSKELNAMEHIAFGLKGNETLTVHLQLNGSQDKFDAFCVHVQKPGDRPIQNHTFYKGRSAPDRLFCEGTRLTRLTYVVSRNLWRAIYEQQEASLRALYERIRTVIQASADLCIVCESNLGAQLHRATICSSASCKQTYLRSSLDLRLQDVRRDGRVVDLLLTSVFAAANLNNLNLLPDFPRQLNDAAKLQILLNSLPPTTGLASAPDFVTGLAGCGQRAQVLMSWLCTNYRGFIVSATGPIKLPKMPSIHQFLVVNSAPEIEAAFAQHNHYVQRHVLFHGTSIDRLYGILSQGLRICSHTALQKHGAASGAGIYTARDPATAMGYATRTQSNVNFNGFYNSRTDFRDSTVLLGLEHAGNDGASSSVHVIKDPTRIMLRYIFIVPPNVNAPKAQDIVAPMLKIFNSLRTNTHAPPPRCQCACCSSFLNR